MRLALFTAAFFAATTVSAQEAVFSPELRAEGEAGVSKAGGLLASQIRDTDSAKFRNVTLQKTVGKDGKEYVQVCGEINAKNDYGAMTGFHYFMLLGDRVLIGGSREIINADEICTNGRGQKDSRDYTPELRKAFDANAGE